MLINARNVTRRTLAVIACLAMAAMLAAPRPAVAADDDRYVLAADYSKKRIALIGPDGATVWENKIGSIHDLHLLPNGHVLFQRNMQHLVEVDPATDKVVWEYHADKMNGNEGRKVEVHAFQRLDNGHTMIAESGPARIIEVDASGKIVHQFKMKVNKPHVHRDTRMARKLDNGHYLVCHEADGAVREYDASGNVVWEYDVPMFGRKPKGGHGLDAFGNAVFGAIRLRNGNTLIATGNGHSVLEVTPDKQIVWKLEQDDLDGIQLAWVTTLQELPNGNFVIGNCHAGPNNPQIVEVNRDKQVVWKFHDFERFGNALSNSLVIFGKPKRLPGAAANHGGALTEAQQIAFFENDVKPLLQSTCFKCHGDDPHKIRGGLWLTSRANILHGGDGGPAVNLDSPDDSLLVKAINYVDDDHQMPPKGKMDPDQIALLERWVKMGMPWTPGEADVLAEALAKPDVVITDEDRNYWAYVKPVKHDPPAVHNKAWVRNPIDAFILAKLEDKGIQPVAPEDRARLVRRVYYDLIGLPPTPQQVRDFVNDDAPDAYEKLIDTLLASPHYGEKWGRHWLDVVRYAETNGYERDSAKPNVWRYRDYVIRSFNDDKPYNQFIREQLAGDELDTVTPDTMIATGYYRLGIWDDEPADRELAMYDVLDDMMSTTSSAMLGMSLGCARCHTHKIDPIPHDDYYRMLAFFRDVATSMKVDAEQVVATPAERAAHAKKLAAHQAEIGKAEQQLDAIRARFKAAMAAKKPDVNLSDADAPRTLMADSRNQPQQWKVHFQPPQGKHLAWTKPTYSDDTWKVEPGGFGTKGTPGAVVRTEWNSRDIYLRREFHLDDVPATATLVMHHDEDAEVYLNGKLVKKVDGYTREYQTFDLDDKAVKTLRKGRNVIAIHCLQTGGGQYIDAGLIVDGKPTDIDVLVKQHGADVMSPEEVDQYTAVTDRLKKLRETKFEQPGVKVLAVVEKGRAKTHVLGRGSPALKRDTVEPGYPQVLGFDDPKLPEPSPGVSGGKRRVLADWIASRDNPLTARVMVNRIWQHHFGRGIVASTNEFGKLGTPPTHPGLLDWLAVEFMDRGWSLKAMHKLIMTSNTYSLSSQDDPTGLAKDPANNLFWRFNMRRLTAEEVRDSILAVNGTLNDKMYGPSIYTEIPQAILDSASRPDKAWGNSSPEEAARRSVYIHVKRSLIEPFLQTFDLADTDSSCAMRFTTTVPTQALTTLNSDFMHKQAAIFADRLRNEAGADPADQVALALRLVTCREPTQSEILRGVKLMDDWQKLDGVEKNKALDYFCLVALNMNEFLYLD